MIPGNVSGEVWAGWPVKLKGVQGNVKGLINPRLIRLGCMMWNVVSTKGVLEKMPSMKIQDLQNVEKFCETIESVKGVQEKQLRCSRGKC